MTTLLSIGDFSRMTYLSVKALRHYHDVGVLEPAQIDASSGYRFYLPNQVGMAPQAKWIAAKGCESSSCSLSSLTAAGEWLLAPRDAAGANPRPDLRPHVINNSWGTTLASSPEALDPNDPINIATRNAHDRNITVVFAAGNDGDVKFVIEILASQKSGGGGESGGSGDEGLGETAAG